MDQSADKDLAPPSSSDTYKFQGPARIAIRTRTDDQPRYVDTSSSVWIWYDGGTAMKIDWSELKLHPEFMEIAKAFMAYALEKYSSSTAYRIARLFQRISESNIAFNYPWGAFEIIRTFNQWSSPREYIFVFRTLYKWAVSRGIPGFSNSIYLTIKDHKTDPRTPYSSVFLSQSSLELDEEICLLKRIERGVSIQNLEDFQKNILLHLGFELAPRAIQFHSLDISDFEVIDSPNQDRYYTLWLPMAKKIGQGRPERRPRKITVQLGEKIEQHISTLQSYFGSACEALFVSSSGKRLSAVGVTAYLKQELREAGIERPNQVSILLRHHLGQGLADQGTPADMIAELLGHNSTVAARAYVTATPNIARIKEKALGKSPAYQRIMRSLLTGKIVQRHDTTTEREVRGVVNMQYIGDIGVCALPTHTHCPYNPVYACYTCKKFHPFADGRHELVRDALQQEAQRFIDVAEQAGELSQNRPLAQHQVTILAVTATIERCRQNTGDAESD